MDLDSIQFNSIQFNSVQINTLGISSIHIRSSLNRQAEGIVVEILSDRKDWNGKPGPREADPPQIKTNCSEITSEWSLTITKKDRISSFLHRI
ncbi:Hypothetical protein LBF_0115 [Leptospira biflexa serovar Patoc strain 'Patoc 1 (Ames)']|nr:Hypothetical protein LBF_0115 [Leptospira biflexa serovar Patoc strain 'Patoc 1 (Ames)']